MSYPVIESVSTKTLTTAATAITADKPADTVDGNLLLAIVTGRLHTNNALNETPQPSGWTLLSHGKGGGFGYSLSIIAYKKAGASEPEDYEFTFPGNTVGAAKIFRISGHDPDDIIADSSDVYRSDYDATDCVATAITAKANNLLIFAACGTRNHETITPSIAVPSGMTDRGQIMSTKIDSYDDVRHVQRVASEEVDAGDTGTRTGSNDDAEYWNAHLIAINGLAGDTTVEVDLTNDVQTFEGEAEHYVPELLVYSRPVTIDKDLIPIALSNFVVKVYLTNTNFEFAKAQSDGTDIWFEKDGNSLSFDRVYYDDINEKAVFHVKIPNIDPDVDTVFNMRYGSSAVTDQENKVNTWSNGYVGVWHYYGRGGDNIVKDSLGNHDSDVFAGTFVNNLDGQGLEFDGSTDAAVRVPKHNNLIPASLTATVWFYPKGDGQSSSSVIVQIPRSAEGHSVWDLRFRPDNKIRSNAYGINHSNYDISGNTVVTKDVWNKMDHVIDANDDYRGTIYLNDSQEATSPNLTSALTTALNFDLYFGGTNPEAIANRRFQGIIGEVRISNVARSQAWREVETASMDNSLVQVGAETADDFIVQADLINVGQVLETDIQVPIHYVHTLENYTLLLKGFVLRGYPLDEDSVSVILQNQVQIFSAEIGWQVLVEVDLTNQGQLLEAHVGPDYIVDIDLQNSLQEFNSELHAFRDEIQLDLVNSLQTFNAKVVWANVYCNFVNRPQTFRANLEFEFEEEEIIITTTVKGLPYPMELTTEGSAYLTSGGDLIKSSLKSIISWPLFTRSYEDEFGSRVHELLEDQNEDLLVAGVRTFVVDSINRWEPRVRIRKLIFYRPSGEKLIVDIIYIIKDINIEDTFRYVFYTT